MRRRFSQPAAARRGSSPKRRTRRPPRADGAPPPVPGPTPRKRSLFLQLVLPFFESLKRVAEPPAPLPSAAALVPAAALADPASRRADARDKLERLWQDSALEWGRLWGVPDLRAIVRVELSHRMRSSLGGFYARENLIRISDVLLEAPPQLLREILCHEAAHGAVHALHGDGVRAHGREWRELMCRVGLHPRVRVPGQELGSAARRAARKRWLWRHRCPVCRAHRLAGRPVREWRCGPCRAAGRDGRLVITRLAATVGVISGDPGRGSTPVPDLVPPSSPPNSDRSSGRA